VTLPRYLPVMYLEEAWKTVKLQDSQCSDRHSNIVWRVEPLLCSDREISKYTKAVYRQLLCKHVPAATNAHAEIKILLYYNNGNGVFLHGPC
jgi:hypothetical protein